jgi:hypothetical protein
MASLWLYKNPASTNVQRDGLGERFPRLTKNSSAMRCQSSGDKAVDVWSRESNREYGLPLSTYYLLGSSRNHVA